MTHVLLCRIKKCSIIYLFTFWEGASDRMRVEMNSFHRPVSYRITSCPMYQLQTCWKIRSPVWHHNTIAHGYRLKSPLFPGPNWESCVFILPLFSPLTAVGWKLVSSPAVFKTGKDSLKINFMLIRWMNWNLLKKQQEIRVERGQWRKRHQDTGRKKKICWRIRTVRNS